MIFLRWAWAQCKPVIAVATVSGVELSDQSCVVVFLGLGAAADRSIRTPASHGHISGVEPVHQPEEHARPRIPAQQAIDQSPAGMDDLAGQPQEGIQKRFEFHP